MEEREEEEHDAELNANDATIDTFCHHLPVTTDTQGEMANMKNERPISSDILAETIKGFNGLTIQSTINDSAYYDSEEDDTESDPKSDSNVATHTTNGNYPHKLLINRLIPDIIPAATPLIDQTTVEDVTGSGDNLHALYGSLEGYCHRRGAQRCACFPDSCGRNLAWNGWDHSTGRQHFHSLLD